MSLRTLIKYITGVAFAFAMLTACGGGGDINFNVGSNNWDNWPWPWQTNANFFANKTFSQNVNIAGHTDLWLDGVNGEIEITGQPGGNSVTVTVNAKVGSDTYADALVGLGLLEVSLTDGSGEISVQTVQPGNNLSRQYIVDYTITVPDDLSVNVSLVNGHVTVNDMVNSIFIVLENGDVNFSNIYGDATVSMDSGSFYGTMSLLTNGEAIISTTNGDIDLHIPTDTSAEFFGLLDNGTINWNNLDLANIQSTSKSLQGTLGNGSGLIDLKTVNGNIDITGFNL
jgi:DUF4097 and DUF4098 domain-containing protein YvlB